MSWRIHAGLFLSLLGGVPPAFAGVIHVGPGQTYTTIESGYAAASGGDTLLIHDGVYVFPATLNVAKSVTFQALNIGEAKLSGGGSGPDDGLFFLSADATFIGLFFSNSNSDHAIYQRDTNAHGTIRNSIFVGINSPIEINNSSGTGGSFDVAHVTILGANNGVNINDGGTITIRNSIIANSPGAAYAAHGNIAILPSHNLLFNLGAITGGSGFIAPDLFQIIADPQFANAGAFNFRLTAGSAAIDSGLFFGQPFLGAGPDRGAFEFGTAIPEPTSICLFACVIVGLLGYRASRRPRPLPSCDYPTDGTDSLLSSTR